MTEDSGMGLISSVYCHFIFIMIMTERFVLLMNSCGFYKT